MEKTVDRLHEAAGDGGAVEPVELTYSTPEVRQLTGASIKQLDYWLVKRWVVPVTPRGDGAGSGVWYRFTYDDVLDVAVMVALVNAGIAPAVAQGILHDDYFDGIVRISVDFPAVVRKVRERLPLTAS